MEGEREGWGSNNHPPVGLVSKQPCVNMFVCKFKLNVLQNHLFFSHSQEEEPGSRRSRKVPDPERERKKGATPRELTRIRATDLWGEFPALCR